jgi:DNA-binding LacI/PurR family transcriptional regulator
MGAGEVAISHLIGLGNKRIAFIAANLNDHL